MIKAVITDLDGTLLNGEHQISPVTRSVLRNLVGSGIRFMVASGRHILDMRGIRDTLGFKCDLISANGAFVSNAADQLLLRHTVNAEVARAILGPLRPDTTLINTNVYLDDGWYVAREMPEWIEFHKESGFRYKVADLSCLDPHQMHKIFFTAEHEVLLGLEEILVDRFGGQATIVFSRLDTLEVMGPNVNKGNAVKEALEVVGLGLEDAIAFGDGMNDFEMLAMVRQGFVMQNATPHLKEALPDNPTALSCDEDGVARRLLELMDL